MRLCGSGREEVGLLGGFEVLVGWGYLGYYSMDDWFEDYPEGLGRGFYHTVLPPEVTNLI